MKRWYSVRNASNGVVDLSIHDEIGLWGVTAKDLITEMNDHQGVREINVSIHSPGGSAFDGLAIYNALKNHPAKVYTRVEGVAASAASIVLMAGDVITMPEDAFVMIHNPWVGIMGDADELRDTADMLDKIRDSLVSIYHKKTGLDEQTLVELLNAESWLNGKDAKDYGFVDVLTESVNVAALSPEFAKHFASIPKSLTQQNTVSDQVGDISTLKDFESYLRDAGGFSRKEATALTSRAKDLMQSDSAEDQGQIISALSSLSTTLAGK
ncbi:MAG: Clp protease ClpP [Motiliproteus sp.]|nr:Clp protease ClpP [Motiliproteus sp.]MCW9051237.1 Clp protease ClpP [Motiliproteus sp.]